MHRLGRRQFLYCMGGAGAAAAASSGRWRGLIRAESGLSFPEPGASSAELQPLSPVSRQAWALGSSVSMTVFHERRSQAERALDAAFAELELVERVMSIYRPDSQLCQLNRDGRLDDPHPCLREILTLARSVSLRSGGAFDITVQPLWELYAGAKQAGTSPSTKDIAATRRLVDWRRVELDDCEVQLRGEGVKVTLNGIAQGFATDRVVSSLREHGVQHALIDTGEIGALGAKPEGEGWMVGIQHPRDESAFLSVARLAGRCLSTSGDYSTAFTDDLRQHHLFDPWTGRSPAELASVSIAADSACEADALSTAVFVLGFDAGCSLVRRLPGVDAMLVGKDGRFLTTPGFPTTT